MILTSIAAARTTPAAVLVRLCQFAMPTAHHTAPNDAMRLALAANPSLPLEQAQNLLDEHPDLANTLFARPGMTAEMALRILDGRTRASVLRPVLTHVPDPDGALAEYALMVAPIPRIWQDVTGNHATALPLRRQAALHLATLPARTQQDRHDICNLAYADPDAVTLLLDAAVDPNLRADLREVADVVAHGPQPHTPPWFLAPTTTTEEVLTLLSTCQDVTVWRAALIHHLDPTGRVAHAAVTFAQDAPANLRARAGSLLTQVVCDRHQPLPARHAALHAWERSGRALPACVRDAAVALLPEAPLSVVRDYARAARHADEVLAILARPDLPSHVLHVLEERAVTLIGQDYSPLFRDVTHPLTFGPALATHPCATRTQRRHGLALTREGADDARALVDAAFIDAALAIATIGQDLAANGAAHVGAQMPVAALSSRTLAALPPVVALVAAALNDALGDLTGPAFGHVLTSLAGTFTGTVGDLLLTAAAVAA